jgi:septum formation protein
LIATALADQKAYEVYKLHTEALVIGADTIVAIMDVTAKWNFLGKPADELDAIRMLTELSGKKHIVVTGVAVVMTDYARVIAETTTVTFRPLTREEIAAYVKTGEPMDKAGAYAIQGGAKGFVAKIEGSWSNVVGLPIESLKPVLEEAIARAE